ncbi:MAG: hypothetical protein NVV74_18810 [Magnetospirillum sp.]|nr:hypothetical protein [Magnetospirillum sp.]
MMTPSGCLRAILLLLLATPAWAADGFGDVQRTLFVAGRDSTAVAVVSIESERVIGRLELGLVPRQLAVSESLAKLAAADGRSAQVTVAELASRAVTRLPLPLAPTRLLVSPDGLTLAAFDDASGGIALVDLLLLREKARLAGPPRIRDAMFAGDGKSLFLAADGVAGVTVLDAAASRPAAILPGPSATALARAPNGREGFALAGGEVLHFDLKAPAILGRLAAPGATGLYPTGTGRFLMLPDSDRRSLTLAPAQPLAPAAPLKAAAGMSAAYSAWFDTVALLPSRSEESVLLYDLETRQPAGRIPLSGAPGPGVVTPDGGKLYLPIEGEKELAVIDARLRRRAATIAVGFAPTQAVMAGGYGICH